MGVEAVNKIYNHKNNIDQEETTFLESKHILENHVDVRLTMIQKRLQKSEIVYY